MNWLPDDYENPNAGPKPVQPGAGTDGAQPHEPAQGTRRLPDLSPVALVAGVIALVTGPLLVDDAAARYIVLAAAVLALVLGALGVWTSIRWSGRLDYAVAALLTGGVSLYLWISYVSDPPQGGT